MVCRYWRFLSWVGRALAFLTAGAGGALPAHASTFDESTGRLSLADAAYAVSFEGVVAIPAELDAVFRDTDDEPTTPSTSIFVSDPEGLEGEGALEMGGEVRSVTFSLGALQSTFTGRRVEIRFWQLALGTRVRAVLQWDLTDAADPARVARVVRIPFQPTGRATDDGWEELTSGPVDFALPGGVGPATLVMEDIQFQRQSDFVQVNSYTRVRLDALEIRDLGPAAVSDTTCDRLGEADVCGGQGVCLFGRCVDGVVRYGPAVVGTSLREQYLDRRLFEFEAFAGSRMAQDRMDGLESQIDAIRDETAGARFWRAFRLGVAQLRDGHMTAPSFSEGLDGKLTGNFGVCVHLGEADLMPSPGPAPLIFSVEKDNPVADQLRPGDVLTAIDGLAPYDWAEAVGLPSTYEGDPRGFDMVISHELIPWAAQGGSTVTFSRCPADATPVPCAASELQEVEIDFAALYEQTLWQSDLAGWLGDDVTCDFRFQRAVTDDGVRGYDFAGYVDDGPVRVLIINGEPSPGYEAGDQWRTTVDEALDPPPDSLILDQRTGFGGAIDTTDYLMGRLIGEADFERMEIVPWLDRPLDSQVWSVVNSCHSYWCGDFMTWSLHDYSRMDSAKRGVAAGTRVAVLNAFDVSGNDYTTKLFTYRSGPTRIFGNGVSFGAFGPRFDLPSHLDSFWGGSMQLWDTVFLADSGDPLDAFATGTGIEPDVQLLQKQSDVLRGVDTLLEAARAWLLEE